MGQILEYHPMMLKEYLNGTEHANFMYPRSLSHPPTQAGRLAGWQTGRLAGRRSMLSLVQWRSKEWQDDRCDARVGGC